MIPDRLKPYLRVNGDVLLVRTYETGGRPMELERSGGLSMWAIWPEKKCIRCLNPYWHHLTFREGEYFDEGKQWAFAIVDFCGAFKSCRCSGHTAKHIDDLLNPYLKQLAKDDKAKKKHKYQVDDHSKHIKDGIDMLTGEIIENPPESENTTPF